VSGAWLDFSEYLDAAAEGYIPRSQVEDTVWRTVEASRCGTCLVTGPPGSGKTSLAASGISEHRPLHYFLRRGHADFSTWRDPYTFLATLGYQLWDRYGDQIFPSAVAITVEGKVYDLEATGSVVGAQIERLVPLPWRATRVRVALEARRIRGAAVGVAIGEVLEDYHFLTLEAFRQIALLDPLRRLAATRPEERVVLWVDGLDEDTDVQDAPDATITRLLPNAVEACELGNLFVVVTSRPGNHLDSLRQGTAATVDLSDFRHENRTSITRVVDQEIADPAVLDALAAAEWDSSEARRTVLQAAQDNFMYVRQFFVGVRSGEADALRTGGLPQSLDDLHARLVCRLVAVAGATFDLSTFPVVEVLSVAREGLIVDQISTITGLPQKAVRGELAKLRPFLDPTKRPDRHDARVSLFHTTFRETLVGDAHRHERSFVDPAEAHGRIADAYLRLEASGWDGLDEYGRRRFTTHLRSGTTAHQRRLLALIGEPWRRARGVGSTSNRGFSEDLAAAVTCLGTCPTERVLPLAAKLSQMAVRAKMSTDRVPAEGFAVMAMLNRQARALEYVKPAAPDDLRRVAELIRGLSAASDPDWDLVSQLRDQALHGIRERPDHAALSQLLAACPSRDDPGSRSFLDQAIEVFEGAPAYWATPPALAQLARLFTVIDHDQAESAFRQSLESIPKLSSSAQTYYYSVLLDVWGGFDPDAALAAARSLDWELDGYSVKALLGAYLRSSASDRFESIKFVMAKITDEQLPGVNDPYTRAMIHVEFALANLRLEDRGQATQHLHAAEGLAEAIGSETDPRSTLQNRLQMGADVWISIAAAAAEARMEDTGRLLDRAWRESMGHARANDVTGQRELVSAQLAHRPELLEARLNGIANGHPPAETLIAAAEAMCDQDPQFAGELLDRGLSLVETPTQLKHLDELLLVVAAEMEPAKALDFLASNDCEHYQLDLRMRVLGRGVGGDGWLWDTVNAWADANDNTTLPHAAQFASLPYPRIQLLLDRIPDLSSELHRLILRAALSAPVAQQDLPHGQSMLEEVLDRLLDVTSDQTRLRPHELLGICAGLWWSVDRETATRIWRDAALQATTSEDARTRSYELLLAIRALHLSAPDAALEPLLCHEPPPSDPDTLTFVVPGPNVAPLRAAGVAEREILLGTSLARAMAAPGSARTHYQAIADPVSASLTAALAGRLNVGSELDERANWCQEALDHASSVEEHHLSCLLLADAAEALRAIGLTRHATQIAESTARDIMNNGYAFGAVQREPTYAHALGRCFRTLRHSGNELELANWIWDARVLQSGFPIFLAYLPPMMGPDQLHLLVEGTRAAVELFHS